MKHFEKLSFCSGGKQILLKLHLNFDRKFQDILNHSFSKDILKFRQILEILSHLQKIEYVK